MRAAWVPPNVAGDPPRHEWTEDHVDHVDHTTTPLFDSPRLTEARYNELMGLTPSHVSDVKSECVPIEPKDTVYHPPHYSRWKMEPIEFIAINNLPWWLANVIKYSMRFDAKDGLQDLYKCRSYLDMKIREVEGHTRFWDKPVTEERELAARFDKLNADLKEMGID
jgi:hypothetical protein